MTIAVEECVGTFTSGSDQLLLFHTISFYFIQIRHFRSLYFTFGRLYSEWLHSIKFHSYLFFSFFLFFFSVLLLVAQLLHLFLFLFNRVCCATPFSNCHLPNASYQFRAICLLYCIHHDLCVCCECCSVI